MPLPKRISRRRVLVGMASVAPLSVVVGVGARFLLDEPPTAGTAADRELLVVAVQGRAVEATPPVVVTPVEAGADGRLRVGLAIRDGAGGRLSLAFDGSTAPPGRGPATAGDGRRLDVTVALDGEPVRSGPFEAVFDGSVEAVGTRLCPDVGAWLTVAWSAPERDRDGWQATGTILVEVEPDGCPGG